MRTNVIDDPTADNPAAYNQHLQVISTELTTGVVKLRSTDEDVTSAVAQLDSEDAKTLALREAMRAGAVNPMMRHATIMYGDDQTGVASRNFAGNAKVRPFLVFEFHSPTIADMQFSGDSL